MGEGPGKIFVENLLKFELLRGHSGFKLKIDISKKNKDFILLEITSGFHFRKKSERIYIVRIFPVFQNSGIFKKDLSLDILSRIVKNLNWTRIFGGIESR